MPGSKELKLDELSPVCNVDFGQVKTLVPGHYYYDPTQNQDLQFITFKKLILSIFIFLCYGHK